MTGGRHTYADWAERGLAWIEAHGGVQIKGNYFRILPLGPGGSKSLCGCFHGCVIVGRLVERDGDIENIYEVPSNEAEMSDRDQIFQEVWRETEEWACRGGLGWTGYALHEMNDQLSMTVGEIARYLRTGILPAKVTDH